MHDTDDGHQKANGFGPRSRLLKSLQPQGKWEVVRFNAVIGEIQERHVRLPTMEGTTLAPKAVPTLNLDSQPLLLSAPLVYKLHFVTATLTN